MTIRSKNKPGFKTLWSVVSVMALSSLGGCSFFGSDEEKVRDLTAAEEIYQIGVNAYLWRATLDTLSFMPMADVDNKGGVIITDWSNNPYNKEERSKAVVRIVGSKLSADSLKVSVHSQQLVAGNWQDMDNRPGAVLNIANAILMQARILRRDNAPLK